MTYRLRLPTRVRSTFRRGTCRNPERSQREAREKSDGRWWGPLHCHMSCCRQIKYMSVILHTDTPRKKLQYLDHRCSCKTLSLASIWWVQDCSGFLVWFRAIWSYWQRECSGEALLCFYQTPRWSSRDLNQRGVNAFLHATMADIKHTTPDSQAFADVGHIKATPNNTTNTQGKLSTDFLSHHLMAYSVNRCWCSVGSRGQAWTYWETASRRGCYSITICK